MSGFAGIAIFIQLIVGIVVGLYFWNMLKNNRTSKVAIEKESKKELEELRKMRAISLSEPLSEMVRPKQMKDVIGQEDGIESLRAALCSANPQHVILYGPPGVGKTAAARLVLEEAKKRPETPFKQDAVFVEVDATTARFDERSIADPLIGSVHDPIYQGAGAMGQAGIPQPKKGAVSNAHGGVLFLDEIGELHPLQMNKLLKVLEDRKVFFDSAYYSEENEKIPLHVHEIFQQGLPADFRLIGATTRKPEEIPPAIRSRCLEIFFKDLESDHLKTVAKKAAAKVKVEIEDDALERIATYSRNGREAVNIVQICVGIIKKQHKNNIEIKDIEWVAESSQLVPKITPKIAKESKVGVVNGLAVFGPNSGSLLEIEVSALPVSENKEGTIHISGIVDEEEMNQGGRTIRRKSMANHSVSNVLTMLKSMGVPVHQYHLHVNYPGGVPVDGPSAGVAMAVGIFSAIHKVAIKNDVALTGEISLHGAVKPVGGILPKIKAAKKAGAVKALIPYENRQAGLDQIEGIEVVPVQKFEEVLEHVLAAEFHSITQNQNIPYQKRQSI
ncbi:ATP-dependent protease LonB [Salinibacillus xinjiangensis]|uniref:endopeptidase La n=1 Tax=Salinibacillus xinjiangensis TaxID=1229268 RepID=A0A6G1XBQ4_9BACI|nr:ATP-dependent protease LonB [Salinibacillus xinjiangensis]MRG88362.1 ATP-dependent protease LonB [Salinibacillus xinjiangensis]